MTDVEAITLEADLPESQAAREIAKAVSARHSLARRYLVGVRRRHPDATPAELIRLIDRQYATAIAAAGAAMVVGEIAVDAALALLPAGGTAAPAGKQAGKAAAKIAAKRIAVGAVKGGARRALPAGDKQLQFEITAIFALAIADIHGKEFDKEQAKALVLGLTNGRVDQQTIAAMAADVAMASSTVATGVGQKIASGRKDWSHWADTLADLLPKGAAQTFVRTIETGQFDAVREGLSDKQQAAIEYGVGAMAGGVTRFVFGREVIEAARVAFAAAPDTFPAYLAVPPKVKRERGRERNRALNALAEAGKASGTWIADTAGTVGGGVANAAVTVSRPARTAVRDSIARIRDRRKGD